MRGVCFFIEKSSSGHFHNLSPFATVHYMFDSFQKSQYYCQKSPQICFSGWKNNDKFHFLGNGDSLFQNLRPMLCLFICLIIFKKTNTIAEYLGLNPGFHFVTLFAEPLELFDWETMLNFTFWATRVAFVFSLAI